MAFPARSVVPALLVAGLVLAPEAGASPSHTAQLRNGLLTWEADFEYTMSGPSRAVIATVRGGRSRVLTRNRWNASYSADGRWLVTQGIGAPCRLFLRRVGTRHERRLPLTGCFTVISWAPRGDRFLVEHVSGSARRLPPDALYDVPTHRVHRVSSLHLPTWSPDGRYLAAERGGLRRPGRMVVVNGVTGHVRRLVGGNYFSVSWSADGQDLLVTPLSGAALVFTPAGRRVARLDHAGLSVAWTSRPGTLVRQVGRGFVVTDLHGRLRWRVRAGSYISEADLLGSSSHGRIAWIRGNRVVVARLADGRRRRITPSSPVGIEDTAWAPDGRHLVVSPAADTEDPSADFRAFIVRASGRGWHRLPGEQPMFSPDGRRMVIDQKLADAEGRHLHPVPGLARGSAGADPPTFDWPPAPG